jgi:hypothetical protein
VRLPVLALLFGALATPLVAQWTTTDEVTVAAGGVALVADWSTTEWARQQGGWREWNLVLGPHPTATRLTWYNVAATSAYLALVTRLPTRYRRVVACAVFALESYSAARNLRAGAHFAVP